MNLKEAQTILRGQAPWLLEKTGRVVTNLSQALTLPISTETRDCVHSALYNAVKLYLLAVGLDTGTDIRAILERLDEYIRQHPEATPELLILVHKHASEPGSTDALAIPESNA
jgi:hypothetical protein